MPYKRLVRFADTDAAGVVFFANVLTICHEAYEYALQSYGFDLTQFFSTTTILIVPIVQASVDFYRPIFCGDRLIVTIQPQLIDHCQFEIVYSLTNQVAKTVSTARTQHICLNSGDRTKVPIPPALQNWLSNYNSYT